MGMPDFWLALGWGSSLDWSGYGWCGGSNLAYGTNPPYGLGDFLAMYPKFFGAPSAVSASTTSGSPRVVLSAAGSGVAAGQMITGPGIPAGTLVNSVAADGMTAMLSQSATATSLPLAALSLYASPLIPGSVLSTYIALASASLSQSRWLDNWSFGMSLFVAHYATLWLMTEGVPGQTAQQMALAALQRGVGILTSKSADGVGASYQPVSTAASWGSFGLTAYGVQLAGMAKLVGMGGMYLQG